MHLCRAYAIRDYYSFWKSRNERSRAGKLLLLDPSDEDTIQIFFDDNIGHGSANIVDARDANTGAPLAFQVSSPLQGPLIEFFEEQDPSNPQECKGMPSRLDRPWQPGLLEA